MAENFPHDLVLVVLGVVFRTGNSSGKPLLLPVLKKPPPGPPKPGRAENCTPPVSGGVLFMEGRAYILLGIRKLLIAIYELFIREQDKFMKKSIMVLFH